MVTGIEGDIAALIDTDMPGQVPVLPVRGLVVFPFVVAPILPTRKSSLRLVKEAEKRGTVIGVITQKNPEAESPTQADLYGYGVYGKVIKTIELPGGHRTAIIQSLGRFRVVEAHDEDGRLMAEVEMAEERKPDMGDEGFRVAIGLLRTQTEKLIHMSDEMPDEAATALHGIGDPTLLLGFILTNIPFDTQKKAELLAMDDIAERLQAAIAVVNGECAKQELRLNIVNKTRQELDEEQRNFFLQKQIRNLQQEINGGEKSPELQKLLDGAKKKKWSKEVDEVFRKECDKMGTLSTQSPEWNVQLSYLQTFIGLPWNEYTKDNLDLHRSQRILNQDHYGLEKVKERILEYIAVLNLRQDLKSPIICLYGPPGVGKTSLCKSIAKALGRKYVRMSLGGLHDEAEIRGHRRTYIGSMPGRIIKNIEKAGSANPVFVLDEIDKVTGQTANGDPSSALLEVLDPEQNAAFHDNYLDVDFDLSRVMFIATANDLGSIPRPLLDRMELIEMSGYTTEEKVEIGRKHLLPKELRNNGVDNLPVKNAIRFMKPAYECIVEKYTRESGVRQLEKQIGKLVRKLVLEVQMAGEALEPRKVDAAEVQRLLGKPPYYRDIYQGNDYAGVVTGLAWTSVGGEILFIETSLSKGKGSKLTLTGNLGDVMKESAVLALEYVKAHADSLGIDYRIFSTYNIHIHVPEGATPKDGPSAGITIATSIASALTQRKVRRNTAMTGEITLRGKVLPVGGIKEKILAAKRAGITDIVLCQANEKDIDEIAPDYLRGVSFHYVESVADVWAFALTDERVASPTLFDCEDELEQKN